MSKESKGEVLCQATGSFYSINNEGKEEKKYDKVTLLLLKSGEFKYTLDLVLQPSDGGKPKVLINQPLNLEANTHFDKNTHSLVWVTFIREIPHAWRLVFANPAEEATFKTHVAIALHETTTGKPFAKIITKAEEKDFILQAHGQDQMDIDYSDDDEESQSEDESPKKRESKGSAEKKEAKMKRFSTVPFKSPPPKGWISKDDDSDREEEDDRESNRNLEVGKTLNRTFVVRGSKIGVFKHNEDDQLEFINKIPQVKTKKGKVFCPSQTLLHEKDHKMLMLNEDDPEKIYYMDLERGAVVSEWETDRDVAGFAPITKYAQRTDESGILGVSSQSLFQIDPRVSDSDKIVKEKTYKTKNEMGCLVANEKGEVVVGSQKGEIRTFDDITKNAKTLLPGLGDPVIGVDVSADGHYILATSYRYLLVIPTVIPDGGGTLFKPKPKQKKPKPAPVKLQLHPSDMVALGIKDVKFTPAHFNTGENVKEEWIVTSTGPFIITWNFRKIKKDRYSYVIKKAAAPVVADQFRFGKDDQVVVAEPNNAYNELRQYD